MGMRDAMTRALESLLAFGRVTATKQATETKQVLASIAGNSGTTDEARPFQALWGHAGIVFRPPADTEVIFARIGDEMVPIASRDLRFSITVEEGEVVIRNLKSDTPARVRLLATGEVLVEGSKLAVVAPGDALAIATKALATAEKTDARVDTLRNALNNHVHAAGGYTAPAGGGPVTGIGGSNTTTVTSLATVASSRVFSKD